MYKRQALATLLQLFPLGKKGGFRLGAGLPVILGVSFAYVPSMQAIAEQYGIATILGSQIVGGICAVIVGIMIKKIRKFFPDVYKRQTTCRPGSPKSRWDCIR